jgi:hypothetical protein
VRIAAGVCALLLLAGLGASAAVLAGRIRVEADHDQVELVVDYDEVVTLAGAAGLPLAQVLDGLAAQGVTGVGIAEDSLESLVQTGRAQLAAPDPTAPSRGDRSVVSVQIADADRGRRVARNLSAKWHVLGEGWRADDPVVRVMGSMDRLAQVGVGWDSERVNAVRAAGLEPVARPLDSPVISEEGIHHTFAELAREGMDAVLFQGKFVLGNRDLIPMTASEIKGADLKYYAVELNVQEGTERLAGLLDGRVIRTHSIGEAELLRMSRQAAVERFARGVRERSIRCCFVRLLLDRACADPMAFNQEYVSMIREELVASGFVADEATVLPSFNDDHRLDPLVGLGIAGGVGLALLLLLGYGRLWAGLTAVVLVLSVVQPWLPGPGREALGLLAALAFPILGISVVRLDRPGGHPGLRPVHALLVASATCAAGGVLIAGLMSDTLTMMRVEIFRGTKLALGGPVIAAALIYGLDLLNVERPIGDRLSGAWERLRDLATTPMSLGLFVAILIAAGAAAYMLARSGNAAASTQTGAEKALRETLEGLLVYRPRTKEFLIGHPALVLAAFLAACGRLQGRTLLAAAATLGLSSLVNTFCHFHTPLMATLLRSLYGVLIGGMLGLGISALLAIWWRVAPERRRHGPASP